MAVDLSLRAGANMEVPARPVRLELDRRGGPEVDVCAVLVASSGKVRSDADFVFFNQPVHPSGAVEVSAGSFMAALPEVERDIETIVLAGSVDTGTFPDIAELRLNILTTPGDLLAQFVPSLTQPVTTMVFGELYRRGGGWKFRAVGQGWDSGLAGLATNYGIQVDDESDPAPADTAAPVPAGRSQPSASAPVGGSRPDWYPDPADPSSLRWWDGAAWAEHRTPVWQETESHCGGCGAAKRKRLGLGTARCTDCEARIRRVLTQWQQQLADVLAREGVTAAVLDRQWAELRFQRVPESRASDVFRKAGLAHLERLVAFAFADGVIEQDELAGFHAAVAVLNIQDRAVDRMRVRLERGRMLSAFREGDLPQIQNPSLHLEADEIMHLDVPATHVRQLASGPRQTPGRLIASSKKLRFISSGTGGSETAWAKIHTVTPSRRGVEVSTSSRGGGTYLLSDPEYAAAVLSGTLRVAKRLVLAPGQRDTRAIPPDVKAAVWQRDGAACVQCQATEYLEFDHVIPHSLGGATSVNNLQLLCRRCNQEKGARI
ncbi:tellurium resistance protein TerE [Frankia sp. CcI49]|uniref:TerD family protein n=1 Tax=Frankia sp. CcI49 TaxID=1745382 RepID=UPI000975608F|nr:TerD family protein [Frankia sp. CcI49]ONH60470.1 tellurium resistance protein TerE [Frankia sp. CcI49]